MKQLHCYLLATLALFSSACEREIDPIERASLQAVTTTTGFTKASRLIHIGQGDFLIVGSQKSAQGDLDLYVTRHNLTNGNIWEQVIPNAGDDLGMAITYSNGFCYATANTPNNETKLVKLDAATGAIILNQQVLNITNTDIAADQANNIYFVGSTTDVEINKPAFDAQTDLSDLKVEKLDANFNSLFATVMGFNRTEDNPRLFISNDKTVLVGKSKQMDANNNVQEKILLCIFTSNFGGIINQQSYELNTTELRTSNLILNPDNSAKLNSLTQDIQGNTYIQDFMLMNSNGIALETSSNINISAAINSIYATTQGYLVASNATNAAQISLINGSTWATQNTTNLSASTLGLTAGNNISIGEGAAFINSNNIQNFVYPITVSDGTNSYISLIVIDQYGTIQPQ